MLIKNKFLLCLIFIISISSVNKVDSISLKRNVFPYDFDDKVIMGATASLITLITVLIVKNIIEDDSKVIEQKFINSTYALVYKIKNDYDKQLGILSINRIDSNKIKDMYSNALFKLSETINENLGSYQKQLLFNVKTLQDSYSKLLKIIEQDSVKSLLLDIHNLANKLELLNKVLTYHKNFFKQV